MTLMKEKKTKLTHLVEQGRAKMVDVGRKDLISRKAIAEGQTVSVLSNRRSDSQGGPSQRESF